ncbi:MAG: Rne/Rng family ribonuclease [Chitinophagales bacterium]
MDKSVHIYSQHLEKELVIQNTSTGAEIALLEDKKLVEFHQEKEENAFKVGDVYLGRVRKVIPGLNAAFVDVGYEKDAFLHYTDLGADVKTYLNFFKPVVSGSDQDKDLKNLKKLPEIDKNGNIKDVLKPKIIIPVQVFKEPISTKGPRLTTEISFAGRYLILTPFNDFVGVSKKLRNEDERKRLKVLIKSLKPKNFGVIVRTVAQGKGAAELHNDLKQLLAKWDTLIKNLKGASYRDKLVSEVDKSITLVRDILNDNFTGITTSDENLAKSLQSYLESAAPDKKKLVKLYKGQAPIFDHFGITKQIKSSFGSVVPYGKGPYLVIEHTEAMHVVDVNSGHKIAMTGDQESNALNVNIGAAEAVARQLRLRDLGGIVIIDFIDMRNAENRKIINDKMKELLKLDKATTTVLPLSKFNLMQITRQRVRPQVVIKTKEQCTTCGGTGKIEASLLLLEKIEHQIEYLVAKNIAFRLVVHPYIAAFINKGFISQQIKWSWEHKQWIGVSAHNELPLTEFRFLDKEDKDIKIK